MSALAVSHLLSGCGTARFYGQAIRGQTEILRLQEPIEDVLASTGVDSSLHGQLRLVLRLREFAERELDLPAGESYTRYADLGRSSVVWSVFAAPEFSLEPVTWHYPVVGRLDYRGYFTEEMAERFAQGLREEGRDVFVGEVKAYSTLGWFADPVLNTFVGDPEPDLAELVFHELTHRRVYRRGATAFNEALATAVGEEGVRRWLKAEGRHTLLTQYESRLRRRARLYREIAAAREDLRVLYASGLAEGEMRERKRMRLKSLQSSIEDLFRGWGVPGRASVWLEDLPNNALLNASATYHHHVPRLRELLHARHGGDLDAFLREAETLDLSAFGEGESVTRPPAPVPPRPRRRR